MQRKTGDIVPIDLGRTAPRSKGSRGPASLTVAAVSASSPTRLAYISLIFGVAATLAIVSTVSAQAAETSARKYPDVVAVKVRPRAANTFDFDVTISSPYDTARRYADAFRVMDDQGRVFGERILLHDHASEQPFTRDLHGVRIARGIRKVIVQARDKKNGYGGGWTAH